MNTEMIKRILSDEKACNLFKNIMATDNDNNMSVLTAILNDKESCDFLKTLLMSDAPAAVTSDIVHVWCAECVNRVDGKTYYHPVVTATDIPTLDNLLNPNYYHMLADRNQFEAMKWEGYCQMASAMRGVRVRMIAVPSALYADLEKALTGLISKILEEAIQICDHMDRIGRYTRTSSESMKVNMLMGIFQNMDVLFECFDQNMVMSDSLDHDYEQPEPEYDEDEYDDEDYDEDEEDEYDEYDEEDDA